MLLTPPINFLTFSPDDVIHSKVVYMGASTWVVEVYTKNKLSFVSEVFSLGYFHDNEEADNLAKIINNRAFIKLNVIKTDRYQINHFGEWVIDKKE